MTEVVISEAVGRVLDLLDQNPGWYTLDQLAHDRRLGPGDVALIPLLERQGLIAYRVQEATVAITAKGSEVAISARRRR